MRWEYLTLFISVFFLFYSNTKTRLGLISRLLAISLAMYGPLYSLVNIKIFSFPLSLSLLVSIFTISQSIKYLKRTHLTFFCLLSFCCFASSFLFADLPASLRTLQYLICSLSALSFGSYVYASPKGEQILFYSSFVTVFSLLPTLAIKYLFRDIADFETTFTIRDAGYGTSAIAATLYYFTRTRSMFSLISSTSFFLLIQTRSILFLFYASLVAFFARYPRKITPILALYFFTSISAAIAIVLGRSFGISGSTASAASITDSITRLNALTSELDTFINHPLLGRGPFYYFDSFLLSQDLTQTFGDNLYVAFNHLGMLSTLSQLGVLGFSLIIIYPLCLLIRMCTHSQFSTISLANHLSVFPLFVFPVYLLSFFISGTPVSTDFQASFFYFFNISLIMSFSSGHSSTRPSIL